MENDPRGNGPEVPAEGGRTPWSGGRVEELEQRLAGSAKVFGLVAVVGVGTPATATKPATGARSRDRLARMSRLVGRYRGRAT